MAKKAKTADIEDRRAAYTPGELPTGDPNTPRNFVSRGVTGRDGDGPCKVIRRGANVPMPNGDVAREGDTFDPIMEQMSVGRFTSLVANKYIAAEKGVEDKLLKFWDKKNSAAPAPPEPVTEEPEPDGGED